MKAQETQQLQVESLHVEEMHGYTCAQTHTHTHTHIYKHRPRDPVCSRTCQVDSCNRSEMTSCIMTSPLD